MLQNSVTNKTILKEKIQYGSHTIFFDLIFQDRKTLGITVKPDKSVLVKAPFGSEIEKVKNKIKKRARWILIQQNFFESFEPLTPPRKYINGETHLYLGRQYLLRIIEDTEKKTKLKGRFLEVYTPNKNRREVIKDQVFKWYRSHAEIKFREYAQPWIELFSSEYQIKPKDIEIKHLKKRWGSCSSDNKILLNLELIKAPKGCIEYVIVHELCHLLIANHNKSFLKLLSTVMPDWEIWKERLEKMLA